MHSGNGGSGRVLRSPSPARWTDLRLRLVSALVLAPLALAAIWCGGTVFLLVIVAAAAGLAIEWVGLCRLGPAWRGRAAAGVGWILLVAVCAVWLRADPLAGRANMGFLVLVVWSSDVGAYLAGRVIGGPRLAPTISPGKTWAGAAGGLVGAACVGLAVAGLHGWRHGTLDTLGITRAMAVAAGLSVLGQAGDLAESWAKRCFGVKDSGRLIPGHGGLLDRLDAALAVLPAAALLAYGLGPGVVLWR
ncbi:MAG TPA: phosphatidate cytidylyltransferase [Acetobacteraceae bacterium]|nr:phosphatidate cytidylyltransferase [Acetobacteraceae bacterium]